MTDISHTLTPTKTAIPKDRASHRMSARAKTMLPTLFSCLLFGLAGCGGADETAETETTDTNAVATEEATYTTTEQKVSYGIGRNMGMQIAQDPSLDPDLEALTAGIRDAIEGNESKVPQEELVAAFQAFREKAQQAAQAEAQATKAKGTEFLAQNAQRPEVETTDSGLQYEVLEEGQGPKPTTDDTVRVHYHGTLVDGTVFDSSINRGEPIEFAVTGVIPGWTEALQMMPQGSKWKLYIPSNLAYGDRPAGQIPPGSTLIFEVELLEVL